MSKPIVDRNYSRLVASTGHWRSANLALENPAQRKTDPRPYIDSAGVLCFVLPRHLDDKLGVQQEDLGFVVSSKNKLSWSAMDVDTRLPDAIGEGSIMVAKAAGNQGPPRQISPVTIADQDRGEDVLPFKGV
jgi:hypothetical protein